MLRLSVVGLLLTIFLGCSYQVDSYRRLRNVEISFLGRLDTEGAERDAQSFQDQINKQFDSNIKIPRLPFHIGRYVDSLLEEEAVMIFYVEGEF